MENPALAAFTEDWASLCTDSVTDKLNVTPCTDRPANDVQPLYIDVSLEYPIDPGLILGDLQEPTLLFCYCELSDHLPQQHNISPNESHWTDPRYYAESAELNSKQNYDRDLTPTLLSRASRVK